MIEYRGFIGFEKSRELNLQTALLDAERNAARLEGRREGLLEGYEKGVADTTARAWGYISMLADEYAKGVRS